MIGAFIGAGTVIYALPPAGDPSDADLVYVIGPPTAARITAAEQLMSSEGIKNALISVSPPEGDANFGESSLTFCRREGVQCSTPSPFTTKGEAHMLSAYAKEHEVKKVVVLTVTPHVARTRYIFARCAPEIDVEVVAVERDLPLLEWGRQFFYQTGAFIKALGTPCADHSE
ncbi:YdcF family protein [Microbacterium binotii]|uniref:YdcF family protein n=1 Tax=Microbacterium binotii TaxID=462710 RepID=UPI001F1F19B0|nr:YdcF family protein [Microbacterium binotii]UIN30080.1 YdcF family protein [Microbacterium binotii]